jgi:serine/threonine protein kinase
MGEVFCARDTRLNREVAIKVLPVSFANNAAATSRISLLLRVDKLLTINQGFLGFERAIDDLSERRCSQIREVEKMCKSFSQPVLSRVSVSLVLNTERPINRKMFSRWSMIRSYLNI